ncbi:MAG: hypothetical protein HYV07_22580 [Deltaproteobacteria bacterium]|nr:hypothetical protein [Deltaproteobacteria bacterium]
MVLAVTSGKSSADQAATPDELDAAVTRARAFEVGGTSLLGVGVALLSGALIAYAGD